MDNFSQRNIDCRQSFEDILDGVGDFENLFFIFWEYLHNLYDIRWGCVYWDNPLKEKWIRDFCYCDEKTEDLPKEISRIDKILDTLCDKYYICAEGLCEKDVPNRIDSGALPEGFPPSLMVLFGTELRAPAFIVIGEKPEGRLYSVADIDDIRRAVKSVFRIYDRIEITNQLVAADKNVTVSEVAGGIAHEISNNITPIIGRAQLLQKLIEEVKDPETAEKLRFNADIIYSQSCKIARIAQNLTRLSQPMKVEFNVVDLQRELREAVEIMSETAGKIKHFKIDDPSSIYKLEFRFEPDIPRIRGDAQQLEQVFINLIINAAHAIEEKGGGKLVVGAKRGQDNTSVAFIQDDGIGMTPETIEKMWKPFFTTKKKGKGTGLGMAIVKNVIKAHGGEIKVESEPGVGTKFELIFHAVED